MGSAGVTGLTLDLGGITFIDSSGIAGLLASRRLAGSERRELHFKEISAPAALVFEITGLADLFHGSTGAPTT